MPRKCAKEIYCSEGKVGRKFRRRFAVREQQRPLRSIANTVEPGRGSNLVSVTE